MTATLVLLAIALLLIGLLVFLFRRPELTLSPGSSLEPDTELSSACGSFEEGCGELIERIFGSDDVDFVLSNAPKEVQRLFLSERKDLALYWLSHIRTRARTAMRIHVIHARKSTELQPLLELRLAIEYLLIRVRCEFVAVILWLRGPMALRNLSRQADGLFNHLDALRELASTTNPLPNQGEG
jgi:hypothetical protein